MPRLAGQRLQMPRSFDQATAKQLGLFPVFGLESGKDRWRLRFWFRPGLERVHVCGIRVCFRRSSNFLNKGGGRGGSLFDETVFCLIRCPPNDPRPRQYFRRGFFDVRQDVESTLRRSRSEELIVGTFYSPVEQFASPGGSFLHDAFKLGHAGQNKVRPGRQTL